MGDGIITKKGGLIMGLFDKIKGLGHATKLLSSKEFMGIVNIDGGSNDFKKESILTISDGKATVTPMTGGDTYVFSADDISSVSSLGIQPSSAAKYYMNDVYRTFGQMYIYEINFKDGKKTKMDILACPKYSMQKIGALQTVGPTLENAVFNELIGSFR